MERLYLGSQRKNQVLRTEDVEHTNLLCSHLSRSPYPQSHVAVVLIWY
jgi:hypothetical protein